ncbi:MULTISPECIES: DUF5994 family protein [unclassified Streptomyces]|uniref:DUF5994 family protein n=1 Tax=unclassified Streptomyces TaxID=2593676 RepID=UPI003253E8C6
MTATVSYTPRLEDRPSFPSLRASQALTGSTPDLLDGAWWSRACYPGVELPSLTALLDPQTVPVTAAWLMAAVSDPLRTSATGRLMDEAARLRTVSGIDRGPISPPRIPAVTAPVLGIPAAALPTPDPAQGM